MGAVKSRRRGQQNHRPLRHGMSSDPPKVHLQSTCGHEALVQLRLTGGLPKDKDDRGGLHQQKLYVSQAMACRCCSSKHSELRACMRDCLNCGRCARDCVSTSPYSRQCASASHVSNKGESAGSDQRTKLTAKDSRCPNLGPCVRDLTDSGMRACDDPGKRDRTSLGDRTNLGDCTNLGDRTILASKACGQDADPLYTHLNLDTHPVVTRLQNEQNLRLEGMEQRMNKIRKSVQQEAERRKFAHLFRARSEDRNREEQLLKEAGLALEMMKKEKQMRKERLKEEDVLSPDVKSSSDSCALKCDKGDIIPVHVVSEARDKMKEKEASGKLTPSQLSLQWLLQPVETFNLNGVVLWLMLPFLLPVLLVLHLLRHFSPRPDPHTRKKSQ